jgi:hypothetical protein
MAFPKLIFERYRRVADLDPGVLLVGLDFPLKDETGLIGGWRFGFRCRWFHALFVVRVAERTDGGLAGGSIGIDAGLPPRSYPRPKWKAGFISQLWREESKPTPAEGV